MHGFKLGLSAASVLLLLSACERPSAVAQKDDGAPSVQQATAESRAARETAVEAPVRELDGRPIWSASRRGSAEENAQRSFDRNGEDFGAKSVDDFIRKAHAFVEDPPAGVQRLTRSNGDVLLYDPKTNVFAVVTKAGAPRTMFKPEEGAAYWTEQKERESRRQTARAEKSGRDSDTGG